jgi:hypothetical protein
MHTETLGINLFLRPGWDLWARPETTADSPVLVAKKQSQFSTSRPRVHQHSDITSKPDFFISIVFSFVDLTISDIIR